MKRLLAARPHLLPAILTAGLLIYAVGDRPYAVYQLLRVVTTATAALLVALGAVHRRWWVVWLFGVVLLLFNPLVPVQLKKGDWRWIDGVTAGLFVIASAAASFTAPKDVRDK